MNVTLKNLTPGGSYRAFLGTVAEPWHQQGMAPSSAPAVTATASATGEATFDLTPKIEYLIFGASGPGKRVMYATTEVSTL